jgi:hypothetical protein
MGSAVKTERHEIIMDDKKRFLDISYYKSGWRIFNLRCQCPLTTNHTAYNQGRKLIGLGGPTHEWRVKDGEASSKSKRLSNTQEKFEGINIEGWEDWYQLYKDGKFKLVASIIPRKKVVS